MKKTVIRICLVGFALISLLACLLCYYGLDRVPYGFHVDELSSAVDIGCMSTEGVDAHNTRYPVFSNLNYGTPKPPTYLYPGIVWAKVFGYSVPSLRAYSVTVYFLGIAGLFFLAHLLFGWRYAFLTMTVASLSPWTWILCRTAFESLFAMTFIIWGLYFFLRPVKAWSTVLAGLFFSAAMYSYPPFRLQTPLMLLSLGFYAWKAQPRSPGLWALFISAVLIPGIPLFQRILSGELQQRFNLISIFSKDYLTSIHRSGSLKDLAEVFISNFFVHFRADFLFTKGDPYLIHSTRHFGILSWMDMAGLCFAAVLLILLFIKKGRGENPIVSQKYFLFFLFSNILIGVIPSALTTDLPNSLRIIGSWPFMCLFSGFFLWQLCERWWTGWIITLVLSVLFAVSFFKVYFEVYPQESKGFFSFWTLEQANKAKTDRDWLKFVEIYRYQDYNARYFLMQNRGLTCTQSRNLWEGMRDFLKARGQY